MTAAPTKTIPDAGCMLMPVELAESIGDWSTGTPGTIVETSLDAAVVEIVRDDGKTLDLIATPYGALRLRRSTRADAERLVPLAEAHYRAVSAAEALQEVLTVARRAGVPDTEISAMADEGFRRIFESLLPRKSRSLAQKIRRRALSSPSAETDPLLASELIEAQD